MSRFPRMGGALMCAALLATACETPPATDLITPDAGSREVIDARDVDIIDSDVYLLPPIGESYTAIDLDEYTPTRVEMCSLMEAPDDLATYDRDQWLVLEARECLETVAWYEQSSASDGVTFIEMKVDADGFPTHYQLNLKTDAAASNQAFRVTVFTASIENRGTPESPQWVYVWEPKAWFGLALFENSSAINVPDDWAGETAGQNFPVKYLVEAHESDSFLVEVDCDGGTFTGTTAGAYVAENTFHDCYDDTQDTTFFLLQEPIDVDVENGELCIPVDWEQNEELCYRWQFYYKIGEIIGKYTGTLATPMMVIYCVPETFEPEERELWQGLKSPDPYDPDGLVYETENTSSAGIFTPNCSQVALAGGPTGFYATVLGALNSLARFLGLDPEPLYAAHHGFGELVGGTLSRFARARALELVYASGDGQAGLIGSELSEPLVVQALTIPHDEHPQEPAVGEEVTFEVTYGDGTLTDAFGNTGTTLIVTTGTDGYARAWLTLSDMPSPPPQTVIAHGNGFGTLVDNVFVADTVLFSAIAIDVVTDFLEPLDEKDGYSGEPYDQVAPHVLLCEAPADAQPCTDPRPEFDETQIKLTEDNGRWFYQVNWKPKEVGVESGTFVVQVVLYVTTVVGESVEIVVAKGGKVELMEGQLQVNPTTDLPIKFTLNRLAP